MANERQRGNEIGPTGATVAFNVRRLRTAAGLDLREMARRLTEQGRPISASALSKVENLERRVDVDDLVVIALVLGANPNALLFPPVAHPWTAAILGPRNTANTEQVWKWARGDEPLSSTSFVPDLLWSRMVDARVDGISEDEIWEMARPAREAEEQKFRARVTPGLPENAGPSILHINEESYRSALEVAARDRETDRG